MSRGLAYDSDEGRAYRGDPDRDHDRRGLSPSRPDIARDHGGAFNEYKKNEQPFLRVIKKHRSAAYDIPESDAPRELIDAARSTWDRGTRIGHAIRVPKCPGDRARADRHDRFHDGLRHHRHRAGHRPRSSTRSWSARASSRSSTRPFQRP